MIQPAYVRFEQSKKLRDKNFHLPCRAVYIDGTFLEFKNAKGDYNDVNWVRTWRSSPKDDTISAPEQWQVCEWLRINHGIWIEVRHIRTFNINRFHIIIWDYKNTENYKTIHSNKNVGYKVWNTPQEAYSAAIDYVLNELI